MCKPNPLFLSLSAKPGSSKGAKELTFRDVLSGNNGSNKTCFVQCCANLRRFGQPNAAVNNWPTGKITTKEREMDLGISGKYALVCASSKGLGLGCAEALAEAGVNLVMNARGAETLEAEAAIIRTAHGVKVTTVACDISTAEGQAKVLDAAGQIDILVTNAGGPPPGMWTDWEREDFIKALDANMLAPIALMKALLPGMMTRGWGRVVNITSQSVKAPIAQLGLSNAARTGLTGYVAGTARQVAPEGVTINNLLPGIHATDRAKALDGGVANALKISPEEARSQRQATIPARRYGTREEFGAACAFLCSQHAGFIIGQNILLDGGATNATF
ncbi:MAG: 3-oxoacyl-[acyl-carrier protein] reductase [Halocynthiibacter sp.]|jgi:3-oxoacyl-[acyl-carrier protein] reductase